MLKKAFIAALLTATAFTPAFADEEAEAPEHINETVMSNIAGVTLEIICDIEVCKVHSQQPGANVWDREEVQPADAGVFTDLVTKYAGMGYS